MKLSRWLLFGGLCYLLFAVVQLPATVAVRLLSPQGATISGVSGSAWNGQASSITTKVTELTLNEVRWSLKPWKLLLLKASAEINAKVAGGAIRTQVDSSLFGNNGTASDLRGVLKLEQIGQMLQLPIALGGKAGLHFDELGWSDGALVSAQGEIQLADVSELVSGTPLGNFSMVFAPDNDSTRAVISDTDASFKLNGTLMLNPDRTFALNANIEPTNKTPATIGQAATMLGATRGAGGKYILLNEGSY